MGENKKTTTTLPEGFYKDVVDSLLYEIFVTDSEGKVIYLNPASEYLTGCLKSNILGRSLDELVSDGTLSSTVAPLVLKNRRICKSIQKVNNGKDLLAVGIPVFDDNKDKSKIKYVITTAQDIAELNAINNTVLQENFNLQHEMRILSRLKNDYMSLNDTFFIGEVHEQIINELMKVAPLDVIILIQGETGTGKGGIAKMVHQLSKRSKGPFVKINCGMIPENLFESELFGYEEGAFTGAVKGGKVGKIELANNGTLFLDEIGELPLSVQVKLLDFIQEKTITRVGGHKKIPIDTRIITATHRDLRGMSEEGTFRQDLFYRLEVFPIKIPPLRSWGDDIIHLAQFFLYQYNKKYEKNKTFSKDIIFPLKQYNWPGNVRELEHIIERLFIFEERDELTGAALSELLSTKESTANSIHCADIVPLKEAKAEIERQLISKAYSVYHSSYEVAKALHIDQSTVIKLKKKHGL